MFYLQKYVNFSEFLQGNFFVQYVSYFFIFPVIFSIEKNSVFICYILLIWPVGHTKLM